MNGGMCRQLINLVKLTTLFVIISFSYGEQWFVVWDYASESACKQDSLVGFNYWLFFKSVDYKYCDIQTKSIVFEYISSSQYKTLMACSDCKDCYVDLTFGLDVCGETDSAKKNQKMTFLNTNDNVIFGKDCKVEEEYKDVGCSEASFLIATVYYQEQCETKGCDQRVNTDCCSMWPCSSTPGDTTQNYFDTLVNITSGSSMITINGLEILFGILFGILSYFV